MDYFYPKLAEKMSDLILAIVAIGILVVSVEYVQYVIDVPGALRQAYFLCVVLIYNFKAIPDIQRAIKTCCDRCGDEEAGI